MLDKGVDSNACPVVLSAFLWSDRGSYIHTHTPSAPTRRHHTIASTQASAKPWRDDLGKDVVFGLVGKFRKRGNLWSLRPSKQETGETAPHYREKILPIPFFHPGFTDSSSNQKHLDTQPEMCPSRTWNTWQVQVLSRIWNNCRETRFISLYLFPVSLDDSPQSTLKHH